MRYPSSWSAGSGLAACAEGIARARFYTSLAAFDALAFDCDLLDNGLPEDRSARIHSLTVWSPTP